MVQDHTVLDPLPVEQAAPCSSSNPANDVREICREFQATIVDFFVTNEEVTKEIQHASVYDVVYGIGPDIIMEDSYGARIQKPPSFRWIHLPINYMVWVEDLMKMISFSINMEALKDYCFVQNVALRGLHSMSLSCETLPGDFTPDLAQRCKRFMLFMPMLSLESYSAHEEVRTAYKNSDPRSPCPKRYISAKQRLVAAHLRTMLPSSENPNLNPQPPLFLPQTLDQYLDPGMDTTRYDMDQLVLRYQAGNPTKSRRHHQILMVDKLWLWNDSKTIITCFWQNSFEMSPMQNIIRSLDSAAEAPIRSPNALALLIARQCTDIFEQSVNGHGNVLEIFRDIIRQIRKEWVLSEGNFRGIKINAYTVGAEGLPGFGERFLGDLDPHGDIKLVAESDDFQQELLSMKSVLSDQSEVMTNLAKFASRNEVLQMETAQEANERIYEKLHSIVARNIKELSRLDTQARKIEEKLNYLISLKDALRVQWEGSVNLRLSRESAVLSSEAAKQGQAVLVFTIFTMVFLPSSFMAAFFAIPIKQLPTDPNGATSLSLGYVVKYMIAFTMAVFVPSIILAFNSRRLSRWKQTLLDEISRRSEKCH